MHLKQITLPILIFWSLLTVFSSFLSPEIAQAQLCDSCGPAPTLCCGNCKVSECIVLYCASRYCGCRARSACEMAQNSCNGCTDPVPTPPPPPPPPPPPSCSISFNPVTLEVGEIGTLNVAINQESNGTISQVLFSVSPPVLSFVTANPDTSRPFTMNIKGEAIGTGNVTATATISGPGGTVPCSDTKTISIEKPDPWFQVIGDLVSGGNIRSSIPIGCLTTPTCSPNLLIPGNDPNSGLAVYRGSLTTGSGSLSTDNWRTDTVQAVSKYNYTYFEKTKPSSVSPPDLPSTVSSELFSLGTYAQEHNGYYWYKKTGNLLISSPQNIPANRKVVVIVDGDLAISSTINLADINTSFILFIVKGTLTVNIATPGSTYELEGLYISDSNFRNESTIKMDVRGSIITNNNVTLLGDILAGNASAPAESFTQSPELLLNFPSHMLSQKRLIQREIML